MRLAKFIQAVCRWRTLRAQTVELSQEMTRLRQKETSSFVEAVADLYRKEAPVGLQAAVGRKPKNRSASVA